MKKLFYITLSFVALAFVACSDDPVVGDVDLGYLPLISSNVNFDYSGGTGEIVVDTKSGIQATLPTGEGEWVSLSTSGNVVTVTVGQNTALEVRNTYVTLKADGREVVVPISQTMYALQLSSTALSFSNAEGTQRVSFIPDDSSITVTVPEADRSWLSAVIEGTEIVVSVESNAGSARRSDIVVEFGLQNLALSVTQATSFTTSVTSLSFEPSADSKSFSFDAPEGMEVTATANVGWITASVNIATGQATVSVLDSDKLNEARNGVVTLTTSGGVTADITITQRGWRMEELTWEVWANGTYYGTGLGRNKNTTLSKTNGFNFFRIDSPYASSGYHFSFEWDIDNLATSITPIPTFINSSIFGVPLPVQPTGLGNAQFEAMWVTDPDPEYTYYFPADQLFVLNSYYGAFVGETFGNAQFSNWVDDYYEINEFLEGNPWE